jgi:hypothetical protein
VRAGFSVGQQRAQGDSGQARCPLVVRRRARGKADREGRALGSAFDQVESAAMAADDFRRDGEAEAGAPLPRAAVERFEQVIERLFRQPGARVAYLDPPASLPLDALNADFALLPVAAMA